MYESVKHSQISFVPYIVNRVNVKLSLCLIQHYAIMYSRVKVYLHRFLTWALAGGEY